MMEILKEMTMEDLLESLKDYHLDVLTVASTGFLLVVAMAFLSVAMLAEMTGLLKAV